MKCINIVPGEENRLLRAVTETDVERIVLKKGVYRFSEPLKIGNREKELEISGNGSVFTCRKPIRPEWKYYGDGIFFSEIKLERQPDALYANGEKQILARYPNFTEGELFGGFSPDVLERSAKWKNPAGGHLIGLHYAEWGSNDYIIDGKDLDGGLILRWVGDNNRGSEIHPVKRMVENIFEELDSPREWFYDKHNRILYYYPEKGTDLSKTVFEIVSNHRIFDISGSSGIVIRDISFENTARTLFTGTYERPLRGDWGFVRDAVVRCGDTENITIRGCSFRDIGGNAIIFSGRNENCAVDGCSFNEIGATGVLVSGKTSCVRNPSFWDGNNHKTEIGDYNPGPQSDEYPRKIRINNCSFRDIGTVEKQTAAVCISISSHVEVSNCTVSRCSRAGININDGSFGGHIIRDNDLFDCVRETADHGPINCWGRDRYWSLGGFDTMGLNGDLKRPFALLDAVETTVIRHNRITANHAFGIDIDDGSSNYLICDNLCIGAGIKLRDGFDRRVCNNIIIGAAIEQHMIFAHCNDVIFNNIVVSQKAYNRICINDGDTTYKGYNLYWNFGDVIEDLPEDEVCRTVADPRFADFDENDFSLSDDSPAFKLGFVPFDVGGASFGSQSSLKPEKYRRVVTRTTVNKTTYYDIEMTGIEDDGIRSATGLPDYDGAYIVKRDILGYFCKTGIPAGVGDVVRAVNGVRIRTPEDLVREFDRMPGGTCASIEVFRNQTSHTFTFVKPDGDYVSIVDEAVEEWENERKK